MSTVNVISISGGKDSTATALLAIERGTKNLRFVFADTGHEHAITYEYVQYLNGELKRLCGTGIDTVKADFKERIKSKRSGLISHFINLSGGERAKNRRLKGYTLPALSRMIDALVYTGNPFLDLCVWKGRFASTRVRFCSEELKHKPLNRYQEALSETFDTIISWQGVRRDESKQRSDLPEKDVEFGSWEPEPFGMLIYRPILDWKAEDCFKQHAKFGIDPNPLYRLGMGRVGCMPCIHATKPEIREINRRFPDELERLRQWEIIVSNASKRACSTFMDGRITAKYLGTSKDEIATETHGIKTYVDYALTERGGRQMSIINTIDLTDIPKCSSIYGLCE